MKKVNYLMQVGLLLVVGILCLAQPQCPGNGHYTPGEEGEGDEVEFFCIDNDGDGYGFGNDCLGSDCNDNNAAINPEAAEIECNDVDENCNGMADDAPDNDGDGFDVCDPLEAGDTDNQDIDCDDDAAAANPGNETENINGGCDDGLDNDCDGPVDGADPNCDS